MTPDQLADIEARAEAATEEPGYSYIVWARAQDKFQEHAKQDTHDLIAAYREQAKRIAELEGAREDLRRKIADYIADKIPRAETHVISACASLWSDEIRAGKE